MDEPTRQDETKRATTTAAG